MFEQSLYEDVSAALKWAESSKDSDAAAAVAAEAAKWTVKELSMQGIHKYMLEMLTEYTSMMKHKPSPKGLIAVSRSLVDRDTTRKHRCTAEELAPPPKVDNYGKLNIQANQTTYFVIPLRITFCARTSLTANFV